MITQRLVSRWSAVAFADSTRCQAVLSGRWTAASCRHFSAKGPLSGDGAPAGRKRSSAGDYTSVVRKSDREISLFGPRDPRLPLPGNVGLETTLYQEDEVPELSLDFLNPLSEDPDVVTSELNSERQSRILDQFIFPPFTSELSDAEARLQRADQLFESTSSPCPDLLAADVRDLFSNRNYGSRITVITVSLRKSLRLSRDEPQRQEVLEAFACLAQAMMLKLQEQGYMADYLDPFMGRSLSSGCSRASLLQLESRFRRQGFELQQHGSCLVMRHHVWGSKDFVGCVFTNAPHTSVEVLALTNSA